MSINPVVQNPGNPLPAQERVASEPKVAASDRSKPQDTVDVTHALKPEIRDFLAEVEAKGVPITPLTEGGARDAAAVARNALGALSLPIANANPGTLAGFLSDAE